MIQRDRYLEKIIPFVETDVIKVITGVRRSGKSMLLQLVQEYLVKKKEIQNDQIVSINLEEICFEDLLEYHALNRYLEDKIQNNKEKVTYLFLDEIQQVENFEKVINSLRATYKSRVDIYVTGSNAKLLSGELATILGGRYIQVNVFPFQFSEYLLAKRELGIEKNESELFMDFVAEGGMPFVSTQGIDRKNQISYLRDIYHSIVLKDIIERENIREPELLKRLLNYVIGNVGRTFSANSIVKYLKNEGINTSTNTVIAYLEAAIRAYILIPLRRNDLQRKKLLTTQEKYYVVDHGLRQAMIGRNESDIELVFENIVLMELLSRGYEVTVGKVGDLEIDFVAERISEFGTEKMYIQVSYLLADEKTREREFRSLRKLDDNYTKFVLSFDPFTKDEEGIVHKNIVNFLLDN